MNAVRPQVAAVSRTVPIAALCAASVLAASSAGAATLAPTTRQIEVEHRGNAVMPFDIERTMHVFAPTADGGVQTVMVHDGDPHQIALVRAHLRKEAAAFARGRYDDPAAIHGTGMPGLAELRARARSVRVAYAETPNGARIRYTTSDPRLVAAIHRWFAAQRSDHGRHAM